MPRLQQRSKMIKSATVFRRRDCHIVILVPEVTEGDNWTESTVKPYCLYEHGVGIREEWTHPFDTIARSKAMQLWQNRHSGNAGMHPHLLCSGDTPYWGGVAREGIVVCCSGFQQPLDRMVSGIVADILIGLAHDSWDISDGKKDSANFLN